MSILNIHKFDFVLNIMINNAVPLFNSIILSLFWRILLSQTILYLLVGNIIRIYQNFNFLIKYDFKPKFSA